MKRFLNREEASQHLSAQGLPCAKNTLAKLACLGGGPEYQSFGRRVVYEVDALDAWIKSRLSGPKKSTTVGGAA